MRFSERKQNNESKCIVVWIFLQLYTHFLQFISKYTSKFCNYKTSKHFLCVSRCTSMLSIDPNTMY